MSGKFHLAIVTLMTRKPETVLIIEDDEDLARALALFFKHNNCVPQIAASGRDGIAQARIASPDAIVCDYAMPGMNGAEVTSALRSDERTSNIPVVLMSGFDIPLWKAANADAFLPKPFLFSELRHALGRVFAMRAGPAGVPAPCARSAAGVAN